MTVECDTRAAAIALVEYLTREDVNRPTKITIEPFVPMVKLR